MIILLYYLCDLSNRRRLSKVRERGILVNNLRTLVTALAVVLPILAAGAGAVSVRFSLRDPANFGRVMCAGFAVAACIVGTVYADTALNMDMSGGYGFLAVSLQTMVFGAAVILWLVGLFKRPQLDADF